MIQGKSARPECVAHEKGKKKQNEDDSTNDDDESDSISLPLYDQK